MVPQSSASADGDGDQQSSPGGTRLQYAEKTLRVAHVAALKGSRYRVLDDGYDALAPAVGGVMPALVDDLSEKSRRDRGAGVTRNLQVVAEAATGAVACRGGDQLDDEATARIAEEALRWWKEAHRP